MTRFHRPVRHATADELAGLVGGRVVRGGSTVLKDICTVDEPATDAIGYAGSMKAVRNRTVLPEALIALPSLADILDGVPTLILHDAPQPAFAAIGRHLYAGAPSDDAMVHPAATVHPDARIEDGVSVGAGAVLDAGVRIGRNSRIGAGAVIGRDCQVGRECSIGPNVVLDSALLGDRVEVQAGSVIGEPGFGYVPGARGIERVVQVGRVIVQDDCHIGTNVSIDRGSIGDTVIGEGTKIGNLQQIAHNVRIGRHCIVVGNGGIAGSAVIGDGVTLAGGVFTVDHAEIGAGATVGGISLVRGKIPAGATWGGIPARPIESYLRDMAEMSARAKRRAGGSKE